MIATFDLDGRDVRVDLSAPTDLSTTLNFHGDQPNAFGLPEATAAPFEAGGFVGDTRQGGSVNCENVFLNPHGNGTHTECVGHIVDTRISVSDILQDIFSPAYIVTVRPEALESSGESYAAPHESDDRVVTCAALKAALGDVPWPYTALVVRTLPNDDKKRTMQFSGNNPVFFSSDAMRWIHQQGVKHLLVDFPSVDREEDGGLLPNHHVFWDVPAQTPHDLINVPSPRTITEMVFVPDTVPDGPGMISIQIPDFALDAAPSRPRFFALL